MKARKRMLTNLICLLITLSLISPARVCFAASTSFIPAEDNDDISDVLTFEGSSIEDGQGDVSLNPIIELTFSKNVVNISVMISNMSCFHLIDSNGDPVEIRVVFPDDQLQRAIKRSVFIIPAEALEPNARYTVYIDNNLMSKSFMHIDNLHTVEFTTGDRNDADTNADLESLGDNIVEVTTKLELSEFSVPVINEQLPESETGSSKNTEKAISYAVITCAAAVIITYSAVVIAKKSHRRTSK